MKSEQKQIDRIVKDVMDEAIPFLIKSHLGIQDEKEIKKIRICLECSDDITMLFDEYHPEITECQCCIFDTEIVEIFRDKE